MERQEVTSMSHEGSFSEGRRQEVLYYIIHRLPRVPTFKCDTKLKPFERVETLREGEIAQTIYAMLIKIDDERAILI